MLCATHRLTLRGGHSGEPPLRISGSPSLKDLRKVASEQGVTTRPSLGDLRKLAKEQNRGMPENVLRTVKTEVTGISVGNVERSAVCAPSPAKLASAKGVNQMLV